MIHLDDLLARYPALRCLPPHLGALVGREAQRVLIPSGRVLFDPGSPCYSFLMLTAGSIRVTKPSASGREILLYRLQPGDSCILTVSCLLGDAHYPARGVVEADVTGIALPRGIFNQLLEASREFREFVFSFFAERIAHLMLLVEDLAFKPLEERLAAVLLSKGEVVEVTHQQLADELGSVREVISRILKEFEGQGAVHLARGCIRVVDRARLVEIADGLRDSSH